MAFERLDLDAGDLDADAPGGRAELPGGNAAIHQPSLHFAAADNRTAVFGGDLVGVAEMVEGSVADDDKIDLVEIPRLGQRAGILVEERIAEDAHPRTGDDLVGGDAVEADAGRGRGGHAMLRLKCLRRQGVNRRRLDEKRSRPLSLTSR